MKKIILYFFALLIWHCTVNFEHCSAETASTPTKALAQEMSQIQNLIYGEIKVTLSKENKDALTKALFSDKVALDTTTLGSHLFSLVDLQSPHADITIGISGQDSPTLTLRKKDDSFQAFNLTAKNLNAAKTVADNITEEAFKNGTSNLPAIIASFGVMIKDRTKADTKVILNAQDKRELPLLLQVTEWKFSNKYNYNKAKRLNTIFITAENDYMKVMRFAISNNAYFVDFTFDDDFSSIILEVPKKTFENLGLL